MATHFGYGVVVRRASDFPFSFETYTWRNCEGVEELPVGTRVLVLPRVAADVGWTPVVVADNCRDGARFTWHTPGCIQLLANLGGRVVVGHTLARR